MECQASAKQIIWWVGGLLDTPSCLRASDSANAPLPTEEVLWALPGVGGLQLFRLEASKGASLPSRTETPLGTKQRAWLSTLCRQGLPEALLSRLGWI